MSDHRWALSADTVKHITGDNPNRFQWALDLILRHAVAGELPAKARTIILFKGGWEVEVQRLSDEQVPAWIWKAVTTQGSSGPQQWATGDFSGAGRVRPGADRFFIKLLGVSFDLNYLDAVVPPSFRTAGSSLDADKGLDDLSPYIRLMIEASRALNIDCGANGGMPLKKVVEPKLRELAPKFGLSPSETQFEQLATFVRTPDAQKGGNRKPSTNS